MWTVQGRMCIGLSISTCAHSECLWYLQLSMWTVQGRMWGLGLGGWLYGRSCKASFDFISCLPAFLLYWDSTASVQTAYGATMSWSVQTNLLLFWLEFLYQAQLAWSNPSTQCITEATGGRKILSWAESIDIPSGKARVALVPALISLSIICCLTAYGNLCWWWG